MKKETDFSAYPNKIILEQELLHEPQYPGSAFMIFDIDTQAVFGSKGRIPVVITIDGKQFLRNLARYAGELMMVFNAEMRDATGYKAGDKIKMIIERDLEPRKVELPEDVRAALDAAGLIAKWEKWSYSHQKEDIAWINEAKRPETRSKRVEKLVSTLQSDKA